jgi:hypothetical protein
LLLCERRRREEEEELLRGAVCARIFPELQNMETPRLIVGWLVLGATNEQLTSCTGIGGRG